MKFMFVLVKILGGLLALTGLASAGQMESLHIMNAAVELKPNWTLVLHSRMRTNQNISQFHQARGGAILQWQARRRVAALGGYYYIEQEDAAKHHFNVHRAWGGAQFRLWENSKVSLEGRTLVERFFAGPSLDFTRGRWRLGAASRRPGARPYFNAEALRVQGQWLGRFTGGVQWTARAGTQFAAGYEHRQYLVGHGGHILFTTIQWQARRAPREERR
jgi:hypothetical protein